MRGEYLQSCKIPRHSVSKHLVFARHRSQCFTYSNSHACHPLPETSMAITPVCKGTESKVERLAEWPKVRWSEANGKTETETSAFWGLKPVLGVSHFTWLGDDLGDGRGCHGGNKPGRKAMGTSKNSRHPTEAAIFLVHDLFSCLFFVL